MCQILSCQCCHAFRAYATHLGPTLVEDDLHVQNGAEFLERRKIRGKCKDFPRVFFERRNIPSPAFLLLLQKATRLSRLLSKTSVAFLPPFSPFCLHTPPPSPKVLSSPLTKNLRSGGESPKHISAF